MPAAGRWSRNECIHEPLVNMKHLKINASSDGLELAVTVCEPEGLPQPEGRQLPDGRQLPEGEPDGRPRPEGKPAAKGIFQIVHGMAEHKERYYEFMEFLASNGFVAVICDLRGHGESVKSEKDLGYLYDGGWKGMVEDVKCVQDWAKREYPGLPVTLFGHSMGSLIARSFAKRYDDAIARLIVCGCPSDNPAKSAGHVLASLIGTFLGGHHRSRLLNGMSFGSYDKAFKADGPFAWLSKNRENVLNYIRDPLCGFCFTANGFKGLLGLMKDCYGAKGWKMANPNLPIRFISSGNDPCRISDKDFRKAVAFLQSRGYRQVGSRLFPTLRHEILREEDPAVFTDILKFLS